MKEKNTVDGKIVKSSKLWWLKINKKSFRTSPLDGATFPYKVKFEYSVDNVKFEKSKYVYWRNDNINVGDEVVVTYAQNNPSKVLKLIKKNK